MRIEEAFSVIRNGASIKQFNGAGGIPITRIETIAERFVDREKMGYADIDSIGKYDSYVLQDGDILMSHINSVQHLGKTAIYHSLPNETIIHGMNLLGLRAIKNVMNPEYANYFFNSRAFLFQLPRITKKSVNQASFTVTELKKLSIPCPTLEMQQHVVGVLKKIDGIIDGRKKQMLKLDELVKSRFIEMFGDKNFDRLPWEDVFVAKTGKLDANAMVEDGKYPFFTCAKEIYRIDNYAFDQEALLLAGNNAVGKYDVKYYNGKFNAYQRTYVLSLKHKWSYELFKFQLEDKLLSLQQQSLGGLTKYLTIKILRGLDFIVPPIELQNEFADFVNSTDKSKKATQKSLDDLETLKKSLMQQYFA